ncbi:MAG: DUF2240 family protein, partial [Candidatus Nanoarchaeia archaeon]
MLKIPIESIIQRICAETGMTRANVENQIKAKIKALDGLVSEEGAAFIVASELGVQLLNEPATSQSWKIKDLVAGMPPVDVFGDVTRILGVKPYKHKGQAKEMGSFILKDDTGEIRVVLWDDRVQMLKEGKIRGRVRIKAAQVKQNKFGGKELHVGSKSSLIVTDSGVDWQKTESKEYKISELQVGETAKIMAEIVKLFPPKSYPVCKSCGKKVIPAPEGFFCSTHKIVVPENRLLLSFYLDDGTEAIRATAFGETAKKICSVVNTEITLSLEFLELLQNQLVGRTS